MDILNPEDLKVTEKPPGTVAGAANNSVSNFLSLVRTKGLSRANRFEVDFFLPLLLEDINEAEQRLVSLMCETTFLPMTRILTGRQQIFGPPEYFATGVDYGGDNMGMNFYLDREYTVKKFFDAWLDTIIEKGPQDAIAPQFVTSYPDQYKSRAFIKQLDEQDNVTYAAELIDLFPVATNVVTLDHNLSNQPSRLNVTFNYRYWTPLTVLPPKRPLASKGLLDILMGLFNGSNPIESPSLKPGFDPFHPETSPASEAYWLKK